ncbi:hypothetical protein [Mycolicibacterium confluentis]|uniref:Uncharacterized protein n=1 Tax=Mycolicibacterium confluentis TaxID=28047 RepID=A0A7I7XZI2_9MYCO|nr:hypothetical protein [Mycolicibacterium confluentis]MCV7319682.1 hypothetical protein [Mycolicibacterium confluentis]ORV34278.1 hypothetical protein AWB99_01190 [Mycolicibacterium confluentis]BBZ34706.1 hypothetical protein MCNF_33110 [Mycolicibacterium confluentis]
MTVTVKLKDRGSDEYMRFGDSYHKCHDGSLEVVRTGAKTPFRYPPGEWTDVSGDQRKSAKSRFWH